MAMEDLSLLDLTSLRRMLAEGRYRLSEHALMRVEQRNISAEMIRQAGAEAVIIEDYPADKYSPSCLLLGFSSAGTPLHLHVSRLENPRTKVITIYIPDSDRWTDYRIRKASP